MSDLRQHSETAWRIASRYSSVLASETRDLAAAIDEELAKLRAQCALAKKALEDIYTKDTRVSDGGKCHDLGPCAEIATAALFSLSDEKCEVSK